MITVDSLSELTLRESSSLGVFSCHKISLQQIILHDIIKYRPCIITGSSLYNPCFLRQQNRILYLAPDFVLYTLSDNIPTKMNYSCKEEPILSTF